jgi:hypothetical protein
MLRSLDQELLEEATEELRAEQRRTSELTQTVQRLTRCNVLKIKFSEVIV